MSLKEICAVLSLLSLGIFCFFLFAFISISPIVIGSAYLTGNCPIQPTIPKLLLALGIVGLIAQILRSCCGPAMFIAVSSVYLIMVVVESCYVYHVYPPNYDSLSGADYCNKTLYLFSFIYITITLVLLSLCIVLRICFIVCKDAASDINLNASTSLRRTKDEERVSNVYQIQNPAS